MARRTFGQFCPLARTLDIIGERWTLLILRELSLGPKRYSDLIAGLPGIGTNLLANRLRDLEAAGMVERRWLPPPAASQVYDLTESGRDFEPVLHEMIRWGMRLMDKPHRGDALDPAWVVGAFRATFDREAAAGVSDTYEFHLDGAVFHASVEDGALEAGPGPAEDPDVVIRSTAKDMIALGTHRVSLEDALSSGRVKAEGSPEALGRSIEILGIAAAA